MIEANGAFFILLWREFPILRIDPTLGHVRPQPLGEGGAWVKEMRVDVNDHEISRIQLPKAH